MVKETVTDKLVKQEYYLLGKKLDAEYAKHFPHKSATPDLWSRMQHVDDKLTEELSKRPLSRSQITNLGNRAFKALRATMVKVAKTVEQPQFQEQVHIDTGKMKMIPRVEDE